MPVRIRRTNGARACEALLLRDLDELRAAAGDATEIHTPIRIVVPSASLRRHLSTRIVADAGHAVAGVVVHTLHGFARVLLDAAGLMVPAGTAVFPLLVRQAAREEPSLALLNELTDGTAVLVGTVADLLDAGFEDAHADAIDELVGQLPLADTVRARAQAVVRIAARTAAAMESHGVGREGTVFPRARAIVERDGRMIRARALLVHGFADATGVASDFIATLLASSRDGRIYLDQPLDLAAPGIPPAGAGFTQRFSERMSGLGAVEDVATRPAPPALSLMRARGAGGEARALADRIRVLLDHGTPAESIGVVARNIATYAIPLRQHFGRLGIPFSAPDVHGPFGALQRRIAALLTVLRQRASAPAERWVEALGSPPRGGKWTTPANWRADLRVALHTLNAARVADVALLPLATAASRAASKQVTQARQVLAQSSVVDAVADLLQRDRGWPREAPFHVHTASLIALVRTGFLWPASDIDALLLPALRRLGGEIPASIRLSYDDFLALIADALASGAAADLGGNGAGVQVLDVVAARGVTFAHLFLIGLNRDVFPRSIVEDPLVPDAIRRGLAALLPDLPIKQLGFEEERFLFGQLLSSSPHVTMSWQLASDDGSAASPSPLVDRLRLSQRQLEVETVPGLYAPPAASREPAHADLPLFARTAASPPPLRPAHEHAVLAGLYGNRNDVAAALQVALSGCSWGDPVRIHVGAESDNRTGRDEARAADGALALLAVIDAHEGRAAEGLGPYYGFIGPPQSPTDPRHAKLFITTIENVARCPWRTFVRRLLAVPPPADALESLPAVTALVLGNIVHRVLDRIVRAAIPNAPLVLAGSGGHSPTRVTWPSDATVERILREEATALANESGVALPGLIALMVRHARAYVAQAKRLDWPHAGASIAVVGSEMTGAVPIEHEGATRVVYFMADRVDALPSGLRLTDYKTGKPMRESLLASVANGTYLQCAAYARAAGHPGDEGRYLYLKPDADDARRAVSVPAADAQIADNFRRAAATVLDVWDQGAFFPRFAEPGGSESSDCRFCEVRDACLRNDAEYRTRLLRWTIDAARAPHDSLAPARRAMLRGWLLRAKPERGAKTRAEADE